MVMYVCWWCNCNSVACVCMCVKERERVVVWARATTTQQFKAALFPLLTCSNAAHPISPMRTSAFTSFNPFSPSDAWRVCMCACEGHKIELTPGYKILTINHTSTSMISIKCSKFVLLMKKIQLPVGCGCLSSGMIQDICIWVGFSTSAAAPRQQVTGSVPAG